MNCIIKPLLEMKNYQKLVNSIKDSYNIVSVEGVNESQRAHLGFSLLEHIDAKGIIVSPNELVAQKTYEDLTCFLKDNVSFFPVSKILLHDVVAESLDVHIQRLDIMDKILRRDFKIIVTSVEALDRRIMPPTVFEKSTINLKVEERIDIQDMLQKLVYLGYERTQIVEGKGQFAIKGGIIEIFIVNDDNPVRIELFDDEIDSMRYFSVDNQRSIDKINEIRIIPAKELIYKSDKINKLTDKVLNDLNKFKTEIQNQEIKDVIEEKTKADVERFENGYYFS
jgi:transcription-repair coupling factor (superfamily II helicase)